MDELILKLKSGESSKDIEETIVAISAGDGESLQEHKNEISTILNTLIADNAQLDFEMNAKLRRRIKRLLSSMTVSTDQATASTNESFGDEYDKNLDAELDTLAKSLHGMVNCEEIEKILASLPMNNIQHNSPGLNLLHDQLNTIASNDSLEMNAKLRRRLKRSIESISKFTVHVAPVTTHQDSYNNSTYTPPPMPDPVSMDETLRLLSSVQTLRDVEYAMNSYVSILAPVGEEKEDPSIVKKKKALRQIMVNVLLSPQRDTITNKRLRHRIEKAAYQLDPTAPPIKKPLKPATKAEKKTTAAAAAAAATLLSKSTTKTVTLPVSDASIPPVESVFAPQEHAINLATVTISNILSTLAAATSANELLVAVENIPARKEDLLFCFQKSNDSDDKEDDNQAEDSSAKSFDYEGATKLLTIFTTILEEDGYVNTTSTMGGDTGKEEQENDEPVKIKLIAKTKRKMKRITAALTAALEDAEEVRVVDTAPAPAPPPALVSSTQKGDEKEEHSEMEVEDEHSTGRKTKTDTTDIVLLPLEPIIEAIRQCTNPADIETLLNDVKPGAGSCKSRRTLKRCLDRLLEGEGGSDSTPGNTMKLTSNSRRKIKRVLKIIEPNVTDTTPTPSTPTATSTETISKKRKAVGEAGDTDVNGVVKKAKFRLFIGQMDFDTTAEDLETYLRDQGLDCPINLRILTDRETGKSRGAAFLDICGGKRSLKRCLSLHHTLLKGRRINVEKTSKGLKDEMAVKQRRIDIKIQESEKVDQILQNFEDNTEQNPKGVFQVKNLSDSMMNRLYAMNTAEVQDILNDFSAATTGSKNTAGRGGESGDVFKRLVTAKDGGGSAVDQSKNRGYGGFNKGDRSGDSSSSNSISSGGNYKMGGDRDSSSRGSSRGGDSDNNGEVPWGYSGVAAAAASAAGTEEGGGGGGKGGGGRGRSGLAGVFQSMRGRGGKRVSNVQHTSV